MAALAQPVVVQLRGGGQVAGIVTRINADDTVDVLTFPADSISPGVHGGVHLYDTEDAAVADAQNEDGYYTAWAPDFTTQPAPADEPATPADFVPATSSKTGK